MSTAGGSSFQQAVFNSVNIMLGVGMLSIPYALKEVSRVQIVTLGSKQSISADPQMLYSFLSSIVLLTPVCHILAMMLSYVQGGWATLGVLGLLWGCTNYTGKVRKSFSSMITTMCNDFH